MPAPSAIRPWTPSIGAWPGAGSRRSIFTQRSSCATPISRTGDRGTTSSTSSTPARRSRDTCAAATSRTDGGLVLADLLSKLEQLESRWDEVAAFCDTLPRTLVHGDLVPKNLRIMRNGDGHRARHIRLGDRRPRVAGSRPGAAAANPRAHSCGSAERSGSAGSLRIPCLDTYRAVLDAGRRRSRTRRPSSSRPRSETCSDASRASTGPARVAPSTGARSTISASTRNGSARRCRWRAGAQPPKGPHAEMTGGLLAKRAAGCARWRGACRSCSVRRPSGSSRRNSSRTTCIDCGSMPRAPSARWSSSGRIR